MPLTDGFAAELKRYLQAVERELKVQIPVSLDTGQVRADLARLQSDLNGASVGVSAGLNTAEARAELDRLKATIGGSRQNLNVGVDKSRVQSDVSSVRSGLAGLASVAKSIVIGGSIAAAAAGLGVAVVQGVALASALAQAAGAAALIPAAVAGIAAIGATALIGLSGVGDALKASSKAATTAGGGGGNPNAAIDSARQVAAAQRGLQAAYREAADRRVQDAKRIVEAEQSIRDAQKAAQDTRAGDVQAVTDAETGYVRAQREELRAQTDLNDARNQAARTIEELKRALAGASVDQEQAALDLAKAQQDLANVQGNDFATDLERQAAQVAVDRAAQRVAETAQSYKDLQDKSTKATAAGVDGADNVVNAQDRLTDAVQNTHDAQLAVAAARKQEADDAVSSARAIAKAQEDLADARRQQAKDAIDSANSILDAQDRLAQAQESAATSAAAGAAATSAADAAMAKLSPNARALVSALLALGPAWRSVKFAVQDALLADLDQRITTLAGRALPVLRTGLGGIAGALNSSAKAALDFTGRTSTLAAVSTVLADVRRGIEATVPAIAPLSQALLDVIRVGSGFGPGLAAGFAGFATGVATAISAAADNGGLARFIAGALQTLRQLAQVLLNVGSILVSVFRAGSDSGGHLLSAIVGITGRLAAMAASTGGQANIKAVFTGAETAVRTLVGFLRSAGPDIARFFGHFDAASNPATVSSIDSIKESLTTIGPILGHAFVSNGVDSFNSVLKIAATVLRTVADHAGTLVKVLPFLAAGFAFVKVAQAAANLLAAADIPIKVAQTVAMLANASANRALAAALRAQTGSQAAATVATEESTVATESSILASLQAKVATIGQTIAQKAAAVASKAWAAAQWLLNAALSANPIALVVLAIAGLVVGILLLVRHSATARAVVTAAFRAITTAAMAVYNWVRVNWPLLLAILTGPIGLAVLVIQKNFSTIVGFVSGLKDRISTAAVGMFDGIANAFRASIDWLIDAWNGLSFKLPSVDTHIPGVGRVGGFELGTPDIPRLALGATILPSQGGTLALLAEGGRSESVVDTGLLNKALDNQNRMAAKLSEGSGRPVNIYNTYYVVDQDPTLLAAVVTRAQAASIV